MATFLELLKSDVESAPPLQGLGHCLCRGSFRKIFKGGGAIVKYREIRRGNGLIWDENLINC